MIPFGGMLTDKEIWTVMQYERSFAGGPSGGERRHGGGERHGGRGMMHHQGQGTETAPVHQQKTDAVELREKIEKAKGASISIPQAIATANQKASGTVLEAEFEAEDDQTF